MQRTGPQYYIVETVDCMLEMERICFIGVFQDVLFVWWTTSQLMASLCSSKVFASATQSRVQCMHLTALSKACINIRIMYVTLSAKVLILRPGFGSRRQPYQPREHQTRQEPELHVSRLHPRRVFTGVLLAQSSRLDTAHTSQAAVTHSQRSFFAHSTCLVC